MLVCGGYVLVCGGYVRVGGCLWVGGCVLSVTRIHVSFAGIMYYGYWFSRDVDHHIFQSMQILFIATGLYFIQIVTRG